MRLNGPTGLARAPARAPVAVVAAAGRPAAGLVAALRDAGERPALVPDEASPAPALEATGSDVVLLDLAAEAAGDLGRLLEALGDGRRLVGVDAGDDAGRLTRALAAGVTSFVRPGAGASELRTAAAEARRGRPWVSPALLPAVLEAASARLHELESAVAAASARPLTPEEIRVAALGGLRPVFQPIVDLRTRSTAAMLALSRFADEPAGDVAARFAEARRLGFSAELEVAAASAAIAQLDRLPPGALLFVKVSSSTVASGRLTEILPHEVVPRVVLEVSEPDVAPGDPAFAAEVSRLRDRGTRFSVDETGAGFGSLDRVLDLAPSFIRLAGGLTRGIDIDRTRRALALAVVNFGAHLGARIVADQVETEEELQALRRLGVDLGVGYYFAAPAELPPAPAAAGEAPAAGAPAAAAEGGAPALQWASTTTDPLPVTPRMLTSVERAARDVLRLAARALPGVSVHIAHLDHDHACRRVVAAAGVRRAGLGPGVAVAREASLEAAVAAGEAAQAGVVGAGAPEGLVDGDVRAWLTIPFAGTPAQPVAFVTALAEAPDALAGGVDILRAAAGALRIAAEAEHGGRLDGLVAELRELSWRDRFTGLLNAARFSELLADANARAVASSGGACVLQVRLSNFTTLCDRLGQALGELVLKDVAHALARQVDDVDTVAFIDGSTFGCLLFGRDEREIGHLCREVLAEVRTLSRRRGAIAELRTGSARLGEDPSPATAWEAAGRRLGDPLAQAAGAAP